MREFLSKLKHVDLKGKYGFAFDTRIDFWLAGNASNSIEHVLKETGAQILMPRSSAIVKSPPRESIEAKPDETRKSEKKGNQKRRKSDTREQCLKRGWKPSSKK